MNLILLFSSIIIGSIIIYISIYFFYIELLPIFIITYIGIITSIANHATTSYLAKWIDRITMGMLFIVYMFYCSQMNEPFHTKCIGLFLIFITLFFFILSKYMYCDNYLLSTIFHGLTLYQE